MSYRFPASFGQERLWFLENLIEGDQVWTHVEKWGFEKPPDPLALANAFRRLVERHEVLRTTLSREHGALFQVVHDEPLGDLEILDEGMEDWLRRPFDLERGPLFKAALSNVNGVHEFALLAHHTIIDGRSMEIVKSDLSRLYSGEDLKPAELQYGDFAVWQREWMQSGEGQSALQAAVSRLSSFPFLIELPGATKKSKRSFSGTELVATISEPLSNLVDRCGSRFEVTPFTVFASALGVLIHIYTGHRRVVIGTPVDGRTTPESEDIVGFIAGTSAVAIDFGGNPSFRDCLQRVRDATLAAMGQQDVPFESIVERLQPQRDLAHNPIFQILISYEASERTPLILGDLVGAPIAAAETTAAFDLTLSISRHAGGFALSMLYPTDLIDPSDMSSVRRHFLIILEALVGNPEGNLAGVQLGAGVVAPKHEPAIFARSSEPMQAGPTNKQMVTRPADDAFESATNMVWRMALKHGGADAVVHEEGTVSYAQLMQMSCAIARSLENSGIGEGDFVGVFVERGPWMIAAVLGVMWTGAAYLPMDPQNPDRRLGFMCADSGIRLVISGPSLVARLPENMKVVLVSDVTETEAFEPKPVTPDAAAYMIYTSGSTGEPKGAVVGHLGLTNLVVQQVRAFELHSSSRVLQFASIGFDASVSEILTTLAAGGTLVVLPRPRLLPGGPLASSIREDRITAVTLPPSALAMLDPQECSDLETLVVAGEALPPALARRWAPGRKLINAYGPTETAVCATLTDRPLADDTVNIGHPLPGVSVYILDRYLNPCPDRVTGDVFIGGRGVGLGYKNRPALTASRFIPDPQGPPGSRMYATGDLARWLPDGSIEYLGRVDHQVKLRGFRIELGEIEEALVEQAQLAAAAVVVRKLSSGEALVAYYAPAVIEPAVLRTKLRERLPEYMVPSFFVALDSLPVNPSGKIDRNSLPDPVIGSASDTPQTETERSVLSVWKAVLGIDQIGTSDKFFDVGGNSLLIVDLFERLHSEFPATITIADLFDLATVEAISAKIDNSLGRTAGGLATFEV